MGDLQSWKKMSLYPQKKIFITVRLTNWEILTDPESRVNSYTNSSCIISLAEGFYGTSGYSGCSMNICWMSEWTLIPNGHKEWWVLFPPSNFHCVLFILIVAILCILEIQRNTQILITLKTPTSIEASNWQGNFQAFVSTCCLWSAGGLHVPSLRFQFSWLQVMGPGMDPS